MIRYHVKSLFRGLYAALRRKGSWFEVRYHARAIWSDVIHPIRCLVYGLRNLFAYFPIIWHDRDWDYSSMLTLWEKKFSRMAYLFEHYGHHLDDDKRARQLRVCAALCARIRDDKYHDADQERHDKKWGKSVWVTLPKRDPKARSVETRFIRAGVRCDADAKLESEEFRRWIKKGDAMRQADIVALTSIVNKNLLGWWD